MDATTTALREWALYLAAMGWPVFPLRPNSKTPALHGQATCPGTGVCASEHQGWEQRATTDPDRIRAAWSTAPFNIGLATGPAHLVVVDLDTPAKTGRPDPDGATVLAHLCHQRGVELPDTYTVTTPNGGTHHYYTAPPGVQLRNTSDALGAHIDTRAAGGYVVAPGSLLPEGGYELHDDRDPVELPAWLVQALLEKPAQTTSARAEIPPERRDSYTTAALRNELARVQRAARGQHNATLSRAAYALGQLVGAGLLDRDAAARDLTAAASHMATGDCDCTTREITRVIHAGLDAGTRRPRTARPGTEAA
ncbi:Bifunctional DNA primase/polymerase, N-terminal [Haloechinothrix alba]|uniref:Bifunctional DNA primase/polymerase, N-terminal n=1 Tax=Haloechinothrix alba TaxID=664784 RepID=A0A238ZVV7_9PSEU|nr:bifunctional DNA primase/polymerase [Haloechinothrix alba]SNR87369.1 Bifunctional DNA primase/polymerase, N-terminal [Haloechinothrix alba]